LLASTNINPCEREEIVVKCPAQYAGKGSESSSVEAVYKGDNHCDGLALLSKEYFLAKLYSTFISLCSRIAEKHFAGPLHCKAFGANQPEPLCSNV
jgi:hypothetical protein